MWTHIGLAPLIAQKHTKLELIFFPYFVFFARRWKIEFEKKKMANLFVRVLCDRTYLNNVLNRKTELNDYTWWMKS